MPANIMFIDDRCEKLSLKSFLIPIVIPVHFTEVFKSFYEVSFHSLSISLDGAKTFHKEKSKWIKCKASFLGEIVSIMKFCLYLCFICIIHKNDFFTVLKWHEVQIFAVGWVPEERGCWFWDAQSFRNKISNFFLEIYYKFINIED